MPEWLGVSATGHCADSLSAAQMRDDQWCFTAPEQVADVGRIRGPLSPL